MPLPTGIQEDILSLLCFDSEQARTLVANITVDLFDNDIYRDIAGKAIAYYREYNEAMNEHVDDVFSSKLNSRNGRIAETYSEVLAGLRSLRENINTQFVTNNLNMFLREQGFKLNMKRALEKFQEGDIDAAENILDNRRHSQVSVFDPGVKFGLDLSRTLSFLNEDDETFPTGIDELDQLGICPARQELFVYVGLPNTGKSWALAHVGKHCVIQRINVVHITLEMSEKKTAMRYVQGFLAVGKNSSEYRLAKIRTDRKGRASGIELGDIVVNEMFLKHPNIRENLATELSDINLFRSPRLVIKQFPTGQLTVDMLRAYLTNLHSISGILPDVLIIDYADLMDIDSKHLRVETGKIYQQLRGIAVEFNIAVVTASQANRAGESVKLLTRKNLAEDFSKVAISDNVVTYNQTAAERNLGLARLYVDKARNDKRGDVILITQNYGAGQYCIQSAKMNIRWEEYEEGVNNTVSSITSTDEEDNNDTQQTHERVRRGSVSRPNRGRL